MKAELDKKLTKDFPQIVEDLGGLETGDGWYNLIYELCRDIMKLNPPDDFKATQIKSKFGGLRFYCYSSTDGIDKLIDKAEDKSYTICENCGSTDNVTSEGRWVMTLCGECRNR